MPHLSVKYLFIAVGLGFVSRTFLRFGISFLFFPSCGVLLKRHLMTFLVRGIFSFPFIDRELTTWPANNCLQDLISVLLQRIFCSCVIETTLLCEKGGSVPLAGREWFDIFSWSKERWSNHKTIIELGYRKISWFVSVSQINYLSKPSAGAGVAGVQGWRSSERTRLPPMWPGFDSHIRRQMWVEFVGSLLCTERFPPVSPVSPLLKTPPFDLICVNC